MKIEIHNNLKISVIQQEFNRFFPYLRLEFFRKPHTPGQGTSKSLLVKGDELLGTFRNNQPHNCIHIHPAMTVSDLEQTFSQKYGLYVQVFRKSGSVWLETTVTDSWTLEQQNKEGEELSKPLHIPKTDIDPD